MRRIRLPEPDRLPRWAAPAALVALAAALRLPGLDYGLPFALRSPDERSIVPRAWAMAHDVRLDPGWYDYPSLLFALVAPAQAPFAEPSYGAARLVAIAIGLLGVAAAWWLGRAAYGAAAGVVAGAACAVATVHVAYSGVAVTDVLLTTLATVSLALLVGGRLEWAAVAAGLAASAKYPGALLVVPLALAGWRQWRRLAVASALAAAAFAATSPFVVLHAGEAWADLRRVQRLAEDGWLGFEHDHPTPVAFADRLWESLGPFALVGVAGAALGLAALVLKQHKVSSRRADLALVAFGLVWFGHLLTLDAHFDRYVLPLVPVLGALAGRVRPLVPLSLALLLVPLAWSARDAYELTKTDTRVVAHRWIADNVPAAALVASDPSTPPLEQRTLALDLPGPGFEPDPERDLARLRRKGVDYVLVTGAVTDRVLAAAARYPAETRFYRALETDARRVFRVDPGGDLAGPWVALYRL
ncbi:MAG TPA: glycosyltransferase 87 family protein [Gaiellaceae bacterium]|nr:glycosyltransferase 87 family protein [Gaiellaceae bacterium]